MWELLERAAEAKWPGVPGARPQAAFTTADWDALFGEWDAITDGGSDFIEEIAAAYPEAKVVIVRRDFDKWWASYESECVDQLFSTVPTLFGGIITSLTGWRSFVGMRKVVLGTFGAQNAKQVRERAKAYYTSFYDNIENSIPADRRFEYQLGSGWEPLCQFLGKDVPNVEFPRLNDAQAHGKNLDDFKAVMYRAAWKTSQPWVLSAGTVGVLATGMWLSKASLNH